MKYFVASRWRNKSEVLELTDKLRDKGKEVYCFLESPANLDSVEKIRSRDYDPERAMQDFEAIYDWKADKRVKAIFEHAIKEMKDTDILILLLPAGASAHLEAGIAYGLGKKCILIGEKKEAESIYLVFDEFYDSIDEFIRSLN